MFRKIMSFLIFSTVPGFCLYMGSPVEPETISIGPVFPEDSLVSMKLGFEQDFMFDNKLKTYLGPRVNRFSYLLSQGVATLGILNRAEAYVSLGSMEASFSYQDSFLHRKVDCETKDQLTWGTGGRILLWRWGSIGLGMQGSYQWAEMYLRDGTVNGASFPIKQPKRKGMGIKESKLIYDQWQVSFGASYQVSFFIPYIGIKGTNTKAKLFNLPPGFHFHPLSTKMRNRTWVGLVLGVTLAAPRVFDFTAEFDLFDSQALSLVGNIRF